MESKNLEQHESGLRSLMEGDFYQSFRTLQEAQKAEFATVIFEGDWGGTIFASYPASDVKCAESDLRDLVKMIDSVYWDNAEGAQIYFEARKAGDGIAGGMGGGVAEKSIWIHPNIIALGFRPIIEGVIKSENPSSILAKQPLRRSELRSQFPELFKLEGWGIRVSKSDQEFVIQMGDFWGRTLELRAATEETAISKGLEAAKRIQDEIVATNRHPSL